MEVANDNALTQPRSGRMALGETVPDRGQQRIRRERLAQAARGAELERHPQEVGRGRIQICKGIARHRDQRMAGARS